MAAPRNTGFTYANPSNIDPNLICTICTDPFWKPVFGAKCGHTFCRSCLEKWMVEDKSCPSCRKEIISLTSITVAGGRSLIDQLNRLSVGCSDCRKAGIQRGDFEDHRKKCAGRLVRCSAAAIRCDWKGRTADLTAHEAQCDSRTGQTDHRRSTETGAFFALRSEAVSREEPGRMPRRLHIWRVCLRCVRLIGTIAIASTSYMSAA